MLKLSPKWLSWARDVAIFAAVFFVITLWQGRNLLDADGSVTVNSHQLVSLAGEVQPLSVPGKQTLVYFFAPWCSVCAVSIGNLEGMESEDLRVVRIALDYASVEAVQAFVDDNEVAGEVLLGTADYKQTFSIPGYPTYYLLDEQNTVVARSFGYSTALGLRLQALLNQSG